MRAFHRSCIARLEAVIPPRTFVVWKGQEIPAGYDPARGDLLFVLCWGDGSP